MERSNEIIAGTFSSAFSAGALFAGFKIWQLMVKETPAVRAAESAMPGANNTSLTLYLATLGTLAAWTAYRSFKGSKPTDKIKKPGKIMVGGIFMAGTALLFKIAISVMGHTKDLGGPVAIAVPTVLGLFTGAIGVVELISAFKAAPPIDKFHARHATEPGVGLRLRVDSSVQTYRSGRSLPLKPPHRLGPGGHR